MTDLAQPIPGLPAAPAAADADTLVGVRGAKVYQFPIGLVRDPLLLKSQILTADFTFDSIANTGATPIRLINYNESIEVIEGVVVQLGVGTCTVAMSIADLDGSNASAITGLGGILTTTTLQVVNATAANLLNKTGSTRRKLLLALSAVSVGAGPLYLTPRYRRYAVTP